MDVAIFIFTWIAVLGVPPLALVIFVLTRKKWPGIQAILVRTAIAWIVLTAAFLFLRIGFLSAFANVAAIMMAYLAYSFFVASCWAIREKILRFIVIAIGLVPIGFGYMLGTIGALGLGFIVGDLTSKPIKTEQVEAGLVCEVKGWGSVATDSGYAVTLYKYWPGFPIVRRAVTSISVDETEGQPDANCADAIAKYKHLP
jgi:hypothetical protein